MHSNAQIKQSAIDNFTISKNAKNLLSNQNEKVNEDELFIVQSPNTTYRRASKLIFILIRYLMVYTSLFIRNPGF
jgi:ribonuclease HIII